MSTEPQKPRLLLVDDDQPVLDALYRFCRQRKWEAVKANSGAEALLQLEQQDFDMVISDMRMPQMDGAQLLKQVKEQHPDTVRILLTGYADMEAVIAAINDAKIFNYLHKPWDDNLLANVIESALDYKRKENQRLQLVQQVADNNEQLKLLNESLEAKVEERTHALKEALAEAKSSNQRINKNFRECLGLLTSIIELHGGSEKNTTHMMVNACVSIAQSLELSPKEVEQVRIAALLHDLGKLFLPDTLLKRPLNTLEATEKEVFQKHPVHAEAVLSGMTGLKTVAKLVRTHCEYLNGSGYPDRYQEQLIPMGARILCVTNDFQKLESRQLVDSIDTPEAALAHIEESSGKQYDARVVELFRKYYDEHLQHYRSRLTAVPIDDIQAGMVLGENLVSAKGLLLLTKDTVLDQENIDQLKKYSVDMGSELVFSILTESIDALSQQE